MIGSMWTFLVRLTVTFSVVTGFFVEFHESIPRIRRTRLESTLEDIERDVRRYLEVRDELQLESPTSIEVSEAGQVLEMLRPSGWNRDTEKEELERRSDKRLPKSPHPLNYIELTRHGFEDLIMPIMELGGPHLVGGQLGIVWEEAIDEPWDVSLKPVRTESYAFDNRGSLRLGSSLESEIAASGDLIDMKAVKARIANMTSNGEAALVMTRSPNGEDYEESRRGRVKIKYVAPPRGNRFRLRGLDRLYLVVTLASESLAHGRASLGFVASHPLGGLEERIVAAAGVLGTAFTAAAIVSAGLAYVRASKAGLPTDIWAIRALFGGPNVLLDLERATTASPAQSCPPSSGIESGAREVEQEVDG